MTIFKAGRAKQSGVHLTIATVSGNLALASMITITLLAGIVLASFTALLFIIRSSNPMGGFGIAIALTVIFNLGVFFLAPLVMDLVQGYLYQTRWVSVAEIEQRSPETGRVLRRVCSQRGITLPRLGVINDQNPTAFTYGSLPSSARLVVSEGLFTYLAEDEIAAVYAHELGHIVHWDFAVMTAASTLVQVAYLCYAAIRSVSHRVNNDNAEKVAWALSFTAYIFYLVGTYLLLYLSRVREYFADHFSAEVTGNPNGLSRALVKIAYGILSQGETSQQPSQLLQGTRALGIYDAKTALSAGTAYQVASSAEEMGRVFLWDMFNPWASWLELNSTHPLTGKRVRALTTYAEQLGLDAEFDMARVSAEGRRLDKKRLFATFWVDVALMYGEWFSAIAGASIGFLVFPSYPLKAYIALPLMLVGFTLIGKCMIMFPSSGSAPTPNILSLMSDPYASPLRGQFVQIQGKIIGRGSAGYVFGSDLKLQDPTGMIYLLYSSRWGGLGNLLFGMKRAQSLIGLSAQVRGWFRRGMVPWLDLASAQTENNTKITSHPAFWLMMIAFMAIALSLVIFLLAPAGDFQP